MSIIKEEKLLLEVLKGYVGEFGPDNVTVKVPSTWKGTCGTDLGPSGVGLSFCTRDTIEVCSEYYGRRFSTAVTEG